MEGFMNRFATTFTAAAVGFFLAGTVFTGCSGGGGTTTPACGAGKAQLCAIGGTCAVNADCNVGLTCNQTTKKCEMGIPPCTADSQCDATRNAACTTAGACICLEGACQLRGCSSDALCAGGQICLAGKCQSRPASTGLRCNILTPSSVIRQGQTLALRASATNANGASVAGQTFTWQSSATGVATVDANGVVTGGSTTGNTNVTCRVTGGDATDSSPVVITNYANVTSGNIRAVVVDDRTGAPVMGAAVLFRQGSTTVGGAAVSTGADGVAQVTAVGAVDVHVFKNGYTYVSIIGVSATDVLVPLQPTPDTTKAGGFTGTFNLAQVSNPTDTVEFGLAGGSIAGPFIDLDFTKLIGITLQRHVQIGSLLDDDVGLPSGLYLKLGDQAIQDRYYALVQAGKRHAWGLGGKVPFDQLIRVLTPVLSGGTENIPFGQIIAQVLPFFDKFRHFIKADMTIVEAPLVADTDDINGDGETTDLVPDFNNATAFQQVNAVVTQPLSLSTSVTVPTLPRYGNQFLPAAIVLAGANTVGRGLVPLGISAGIDNPKQGEAQDGQIDVDANTAGNQSTITFKMSPLHSGIEGSKYFIATLSLALDFGGNSAPAISGIITQPESIAATTSLGGQTFLSFPETAAFNLSDRSFNLGAEVTGASFYRADFKASDGDWVVYFKKPSSGAAFSLPAVPSSANERAVLTSGCSGGGSCTNLRVFALKTGSLTLDSIAGFGTDNLTRLNDYIQAFSNAPCQANGSCAKP
jgi:hypothetical protein